MYRGLTNVLLVLLASTRYCSCNPANPRDGIAIKPLVYSSSLANLTSLVGAIPPEFQAVPDLEVPVRFPAEACFVNLVAAMGAIALDDFTGKMGLTSYRTTRFPQPVIRMNSPGLVDVERRFMVWGLFLVAYYVNRYNACNVGFFSLQWKGKEIAGIGIAGTPRTAGQRFAMEGPSSNEEIKVDFAFLGPPLDLGKGSVFMTILASVLEAAPQDRNTNIYQTVINYVNDEPTIFIVTPTAVARSARGPYFTNELLIDTMARTAEFYAATNTYRQLGLNISVDGIMVAQGVLGARRNVASLPFLNSTEIQAQQLSVA